MRLKYLGNAPIHVSPRIVALAMFGALAAGLLAVAVVFAYFALGG